MLHHNNILKQNYDTQTLNTNKKEDQLIKDTQDIKVKQKQIVIPNLKTKFKSFVEQNQISEKKSIQTNLQKQNDYENDYQKGEVFIINSQTDSFVYKSLQNQISDSHNTLNNRNENNLRKQSNRNSSFKKIKHYNNGLYGLSYLQYSQLKTFQTFYISAGTLN
ncbi:hypothetical protein ABPG73_010181 [Tetrahymena malaccensis]